MRLSAGNPSAEYDQRDTPDDEQAAKERLRRELFTDRDPAYDDREQRRNE